MKSMATDPCLSDALFHFDTAEKGELSNWHYEPIDKAELHKLSVGDIVRCRVAFKEHGWQKLYFQITRVDLYSKGKGQRAVRKFWGIGRRVYVEDAWNHPEWGLAAGEEVCFQRQHIIEVPGWSASNEAVIEAAKLAKRPPPRLLFQK
jgi:predicted NAD-dependent protein-ADP-ribosyltransferase YbiA (DUF1768 family)